MNTPAHVAATAEHTRPKITDLPAVLRKVDAEMTEELFDSTRRKRIDRVATNAVAHIMELFGRKHFTDNDSGIRLIITKALDQIHKTAEVSNLASGDEPRPTDTGNALEKAAFPQPEKSDE